VGRSDIYFHKEGVRLRLPGKAGLEKWIRLVVKGEGSKVRELNYIFCSDEYLRGINRKYLKINKITDVIAFEHIEDCSISGDIFVSVERVRENAAYYKVSFHAELKRVMVHGLLHLLGHKDKTTTDKTAMTVKEDLYLSLHPQ